MPFLWKQGGEVGTRPLVCGLPILWSDRPKPQESLESCHGMESQDWKIIIAC